MVDGRDLQLAADGAPGLVRLVEVFDDGVRIERQRVLGLIDETLPQWRKHGGVFNVLLELRSRVAAEGGKV